MITDEQARRVWAVWSEMYRLEAYPAVAMSRLLAMAEASLSAAGDAPSALLYAVGRFPRSFGPHWRRVAWLLVRLQAQLDRQPLSLEPEEVGTLLVAIVQQKLEPADVGAWLRTRRAPAMS